MSFTGAFRTLSRSNDANGVEQRQINGAILSTQVTLDFPLINVNETAVLTVSVPGARSGDIVILGGAIVTGVIVSGVITSNNSVEVRAHNSGGVSVDPGPTPFNILVIKP